MTVSILTTLATMPTGTVESALDVNELAQYLSDHLGADAEKQRNAAHALRDTLFRDGGVEFMKGVIDDVYSDPDVKELRKKWVRWSRFNNAIKRIVRELSTLYIEPALRT